MYSLSAYTLPRPYFNSWYPNTWLPKCRSGRWFPEIIEWGHQVHCEKVQSPAECGVGRLHKCCNLPINPSHKSSHAILPWNKYEERSRQKGVTLVSVRCPQQRKKLPQLGGSGIRRRWSCESTRECVHESTRAHEFREFVIHETHYIAYINTTLSHVTVWLDLPAFTKGRRNEITSIL